MLCLISATLLSNNHARFVQNVVRRSHSLRFCMIDSESTEVIFDAHCHLVLDSAVEFISHSPNLRFGLMGTKPRDWGNVMTLSETFHEQMKPGIGLHPWFAHNPGDESWLNSLSEILEKNPKVIVGEIGLDRLWIPPDSDKNEINCQKEVFEAQLDIAIRLQRPVSIHCVKAHGMMMDILQRQADLPPAIYFHSYGGSIDFAKALYRMKRFGNRFYFGFSAAVNLRSPKTPMVIASIPDNRLLLESDLEDPTNVNIDLNRMIAAVATYKGWTREQTIQITRDNAESFYTSMTKCSDSSTT